MSLTGPESTTGDGGLEKIPLGLLGSLIALEALLADLVVLAVLTGADLAGVVTGAYCCLWTSW